MAVCVVSIVAFLVSVLRAPPSSLPSAAVAVAISATASDDDAPRISEERGELGLLPSARVRAAIRSSVALHAALAPHVHVGAVPSRRVAVEPSAPTVVIAARPRTRAELMVFQI